MIERDRNPEDDIEGVIMFLRMFNGDTTNEHSGWMKRAKDFQDLSYALWRIRVARPGDAWQGKPGDVARAELEQAREQFRRRYPSFCDRQDAEDAFDAAHRLSFKRPGEKRGADNIFVEAFQTELRFAYLQWARAAQKSAPKPDKRPEPPKADDPTNVVTLTRPGQPSADSLFD